MLLNIRINMKHHLTVYFYKLVQLLYKLSTCEKCTYTGIVSYLRYYTYIYTLQ